MVQDWETSHLDGKCPSQVGNVYMTGGGVLVLNHNRPGSSSRQDGNSIGQDRKCD